MHAVRFCSNGDASPLTSRSVYTRLQPSIMMELLPASSQLTRPDVSDLGRPREMDAPGIASDLSPSGRPRVLLVESDIAMQTMLLELLAVPYQVEAVNDGLAAWQTAQKALPDLILIGLYMRGLDNLTLIRSLRASAATAALPIVILTASADRELMLRCLEAGASNFLLKPFGTTDLLTCLKLELELHAPLFAKRK